MFFMYKIKFLSSQYFFTYQFHSILAQLISVALFFPQLLDFYRATKTAVSVVSKCMSVSNKFVVLTVDMFVSYKFSGPSLASFITPKNKKNKTNLKGGSNYFKYVIQEIYK